MFLNYLDYLPKNSVNHLLTFVNQLISVGVNIKLISEMLDHANINITLDTYDDLMPGDTTKVMEDLARQMEDIAI